MHGRISSFSRSAALKQQVKPRKAGGEVERSSAGAERERKKPEKNPARAIHLDPVEGVDPALCRGLNPQDLGLYVFEGP